MKNVDQHTHIIEAHVVFGAVEGMREGTRAGALEELGFNVTARRVILASGVRLRSRQEAELVSFADLQGVQQPGAVIVDALDDLFAVGAADDLVIRDAFAGCLKEAKSR